MLLCAHHEHKLSIRSSTHGADPALRPPWGWKLSLSSKGDAAPPPHSDPWKTHLQPEDTPPPRPGASSFLPPPRSSRPPPTAVRRRSSGQLRSRAGTAGRRRGCGARARPLYPPRPYTPPPPQPTALLTPRADPRPAHLGAAASAAHRHVTGPQRPAARAAEQAGAPSRSGPPALPPPPRPAARPRPAHPRLPPQQLQPATPPSPHASHSLTREGGTPLARRTPRQSPRKSGWAFLKRKKGTGKTFPRAPGQLAGPPRASCDHAQLPLIGQNPLGQGSFKLEADLRTCCRRLARFLARYLGNCLTLSSGKIYKSWLSFCSFGLRACHLSFVPLVLPPGVSWAPSSPQASFVFF